MIDLSALWAGPLCGQLLAQCGARVIKVESLTRPDGARAGPRPFYDLMNAGKESVALDLRSEAGREQLRRLLLRADVVIESSRPRALEQMGIVADDIMRQNNHLSWIGISGYGRAEPMRDWIAYGDDAGVAAGLSWLVGGRECDDPVFCGDAIADPLTALHAAVLAMASWRDGGGRLFDIALCDVVAFCIACSITTGHANAQRFPDIARPVARAVTASAAELGADTARIVKEFG